MNNDGGCFCGAIRFTSTAECQDAGYCHCTLCQRSTGAPVLAWLSYPTDAFTYTSGVPARYASSNHGHREFCSRCGTQIAYVDEERTGTVEVNVGSLDDSGWVRPRYHIWYGSRIAWFDTADGLPRFEKNKPEGVEVRGWCSGRR